MTSEFAVKAMRLGEPTRALEFISWATNFFNTDNMQCYYRSQGGWVNLILISRIDIIKSLICLKKQLSDVGSVKSMIARNESSNSYKYKTSAEAQ